MSVRSASFPYVIAVLGTVAIIPLRDQLLAEGLLPDSAPMTLFAAAIALSSWLGGLWPGLLATVLGATLGAYFFVGWTPPSALQAGDAVRIGLFILAGIAIAGTAEAMHRARRRSASKQQQLEQEIEERLKVEEALREQEQSLRLALETGRLGTWKLDLFSSRMECSAGCKANFGLAPDASLSYANFLDHAIHPEDRARVQLAVREATDSQQAFNIEYRVFWPDGSLNWLLARGRAHYGPDGEPLRLVGVTLDITERKRIEEDLARREAQLHLITDHAPVMIAYLSADHHYRFVNQPYAERFSLTPDELVGRHVVEILGARLYRQIRPYMNIVLGGRAVEYEQQMPGPDGDSVTLRAAYRPEFEGDRVVGYVAAIVNITDRKRAEEDLQKSEDRVRMAVESAAIGTWDYDPLTEARDWSPLCKLALGFAPDEEISPDAFGARLHPEDREYVLGTAHAALDSGGDGLYDTEYRVVWPDGSLRWIRSKGKAYFATVEGTRRAVRFIGTVVDITDRKQAEQALQDADRRKDEFLATLAHELRNPLAPICNSLEVLKSANGNAGMIEQSQLTIDRQLRHLVRLVDDLMDVSRITRNKVELRRTAVTLATLIDQAVETAQPLLEAAGHELILDLPTQPVFLHADPVRLTQVFANLLNNACKYTGHGGQIHLSVAVQAQHVVISIRDNGIGIPRPMLPLIFDMFTQVDRSLERSKGGLGIGLTLVRRLVEMHGGSVEAQSEGLGQGSEFTVHLPVLDQAPPLESSPQTVGGEPRHILIVDDNRDSATTLCTLLRLQGHRMSVAHDGVAALRMAAARRPEVIVLDIGLPKLNGNECCRAIREQPWGKSVLMIAMTGWGQDEDRRRSRKAGFDHHLVKPVDLQQLQILLSAMPPLVGTTPETVVAPTSA